LATALSSGFCPPVFAAYNQPAPAIDLIQI
jgi:hypothetical protein